MLISDCCTKEATKKIANNLFGSLSIRGWGYGQELVLDGGLLQQLLIDGGVRGFKEIEDFWIVELNKLLIGPRKNLKNLAAAAAITSMGRIKLYELWQEVGFDQVVELRVDELRIKNMPSPSEIKRLMQKYNLKIL